MSQSRFVVARVFIASLLARRLLPAGLVIVAAYAAYPYIVLFQLGQAIRQGDAATLERLVDWDSVREALKEDVCDEVMDSPPEQAQAVKTGDALPPFGFSFVRGVTGNMIDANVTPTALAAAARHAAIEPLGGAAQTRLPGDMPRIEWAFFESPTRFVVRVRAADPQAGVIRILLQLQDSQWKVVRAWLPRELLMRANTRI